jgi:hypothetical protein
MAMPWSMEHSAPNLPLSQCRTRKLPAQGTLTYTSPNRDLNRDDMTCHVNSCILHWASLVQSAMHRKPVNMNAWSWPSSSLKVAPLPAPLAQGLLPSRSAGS